MKEKRGWGPDVCVRGGAWVGLLVNERTVTAGKGEAVGEWRGGVARSRTHKYTCRTVSTGIRIGLLIHVDNIS